jgi:hypothetical protein
VRVVVRHPEGARSVLAAPDLAQRTLVAPTSATRRPSPPPLKGLMLLSMPFQPMSRRVDLNFGAVHVQGAETVARGPSGLV